jgi:hypothetical protein
MLRSGSCGGSHGRPAHKVACFVIAFGVSLACPVGDTLAQERPKKTNAGEGDQRILAPYNDGFCALKGTFAAVARNDAWFSVAGTVTRDGRSFQVIKPQSPDAYVVGSVTVLLLDKDKHPIGQPRILESRGHKWSEEEQTVDFVFADRELELTLHVYTPALGGLVIKNAECRSLGETSTSLPAASEFILKDIQIKTVTAKTDVTISFAPDGSWNIAGEKGTVPAPDFPDERVEVDTIFHDGAIHRFRGTVKGTDLERVVRVKVGLDGYVFEGNESDPLTFRCVAGKGYVYVSGKGRVTTKDGREVKCEGRSGTPTPATRP